MSPAQGILPPFYCIKNLEVKEKLKTRFFPDYQQAAGFLDYWLNSPATCLALILLLSQFPRNIFHGIPVPFVTDFNG